jgi:hypothetical protein
VVDHHRHHASEPEIEAHLHGHEYDRKNNAYYNRKASLKIKDIAGDCYRLKIDCNSRGAAAS